ncbi:MAG: gamma-glutamyltranspeptidase / glutathione hydrolase [Thermomicrobiales bacterium]|nr:gamma-glutamyltranspeptidase / glutathione hydrolase [Thermomicrobiales bacterium]
MAWPNRGLAHRPVVMGTRGMVASAHFLASVAGLRILQQGGNAIDAAVATAAALNVAEPYMSGIGGVGYMLNYSAKERRLRVLDYVGPSAAAASPDAFASPEDKDHGPKSPLVPSACAGWLTALETYGKLDRAAVFAPAIEYAEAGVPLTLKNEYFYRNTFNAGHLTDQTKAVFMPDGAPPTPGSVVRQPLLAKTFREVVEGGQELFYRGSLAKRIVQSLRTQGGHLTEEDLAGYRPVWQDPIRTTYRGFDVHSPPPPCAGIQYLETFNILEAYDLATMGQNTAQTIHLMAEAMKLSVADRIAYAARPDVPTAGLLSKDYAAERRALIDPNRAKPSEGERFTGPAPVGAILPGEPARSLKECTTHFDVVDAEGNAVSVTQSLGDGFGSGVMAGDTGLMLNNFAYWFDLHPDSPNLIGPRKQIEMCMAPAAIFRGDDLFAVIGTPGSFGILETTPQMISNLLDHGFSIQAAIEAPRFRTYEGTTIELEARIPKPVRDDLLLRGHTIRLIDDWSYLVGGGQGIMVDPDTRVLMGGADPRRDGYALGW